VAVQVLVAGGRRTGLQVHDDAPALRVALEPVHPAGDLHLPDPHPQRLLGGQQVPRVCLVPGEELPHHAFGELTLARPVPGAPEVKVVPDVVDPLRDGGLGGAVGDEHGCGVNDGAEVAQHVRLPGAGGGLQQPAQPAAGEGLHLRRRQPDPLARWHDRAGV